MTIACVCALALLVGCSSYQSDLLRAAEQESLMCGDGELDPFELCDIAIPQGRPGACPVRCADAGASTVCKRYMLAGTDCRTQCALIAVPAQNGDGCCPEGATREVDDDCGASIPAQGATPAGNPTGPPASAAPSQSEPTVPVPEAGGEEGPETVTDAESMESEPESAPDAEPTRPAPIHHYRFDGTGRDVVDSVGQADGSVIGASLDGSGRLALRASAGAYVELPGHLISKRESVTLELWLEWNGGLALRYARIFDIGSTQGDGATQSVSTSFFVSPNYDTGARPRLNIQAGGAEPTRVMPAVRFPTGRAVHLAAVVDGSAKTATLYLDGREIGAAP